MLLYLLCLIFTPKLRILLIYISHVLLISTLVSLHEPSTKYLYFDFWKWERNDQGRLLTSIKTGNKNTGRLVVIFHTRNTYLTDLIHKSISYG